MYTANIVNVIRTHEVLSSASKLAASMSQQTSNDADCKCVKQNTPYNHSDLVFQYHRNLTSARSRRTTISTALSSLCFPVRTKRLWLAMWDKYVLTVEDPPSGLKN